MIKTQISALIYFRNWRIFLVYFFIIPIFNTLLMLTVVGNVTKKIDWQVATSSILISGALLALGSVNNMLVDDINRGISYEMIIRNPYSLSYWGSKLLINGVIAEILVIINGILLWLLNHNIDLKNIFILSPMIVLAGLIVGLTSFIASLGMNNPYFFSNLVITVAYLVSGTIVSFDRYPNWLKIISIFFPFGSTITSFKTKNLILVFQDVPILLCWLIVGIIIYKWKIDKVIKNNKQNAIL